MVETNLVIPSNCQCIIESDWIEYTYQMHNTEVKKNGKELPDSLVILKVIKPYDMIEKFETKGVTFKSLKLKEIHWNSAKADTFNFKYETSVFIHPDSNSFIEAFIVPLVESLISSNPQMTVHSEFKQSSYDTTFIPKKGARRSDFNLIKREGNYTLNYYWNYLSEDSTVLYSPYPNFPFVRNASASFIEESRELEITSLDIVKEKYTFKIKGSRNRNGIYISWPIDTVINPIINATVEIDGTNHILFPSDEYLTESTHFLGYWYYIGPRKKERGVDLANYPMSLNILQFSFPLNQTSSALFNLEIEYGSKKILHRIDSFNFELHYDLLTTPVFPKIETLIVKIPKEYYISEVNHEEYIMLPGQNIIYFNNINSRKFIGDLLIIQFSKLGTGFYDFIKIINVLLFIGVVIFFALHYWKKKMESFYKMMTNINGGISVYFLSVIGLFSSSEIWVAILYTWTVIPLFFLLIFGSVRMINYVGNLIKS
jgi:hypothetical protein